MFGSIKVKHRRLAILLPVLVILTALLLLLLRSGAPDTIDINGERVSLRVKDDEELKAFCEECSYETYEPVSDREITVPLHWNETYQEYNELQKVQGFDLVPYKGKSARELVYAVPDDEYLTLLISDKRIIAAHLSASDGSNMRVLL